MWAWLDKAFDWFEAPIHFEVSPFVILCAVFCVVMMVKVIRSMMGREIA